MLPHVFIPVSQRFPSVSDRLLDVASFLTFPFFVYPPLLLGLFLPIFFAVGVIPFQWLQLCSLCGEWLELSSLRSVHIPLFIQSYSTSSATAIVLTVATLTLCESGVIPRRSTTFILDTCTTLLLHLRQSVVAVGLAQSDWRFMSFPRHW